MTNAEHDAGQSGADVEITPVMIEAGLDVFLMEYPDTGVGDALDQDMVKQIFLAMTVAAHTQLEQA